MCIARCEAKSGQQQACHRAIREQISWPIAEIPPTGLIGTKRNLAETVASANQTIQQLI